MSLEESERATLIVHVLSYMKNIIIKFEMLLLRIMRFLLILLCFFFSTNVAMIAKKELFLIAGIYRADVYKSSINRWDISEFLQQQIGHNMNGEFLFTGALQCDENETSQWESGVGTLSFHIDVTSQSGSVIFSEMVNKEKSELRCVYMSVSGADGHYNVSVLITYLDMLSHLHLFTG